MKLASELVYIRPLETQDRDQLFNLRVRNRHFLQPYEPTHVESQFTLDGQAEVIDKAIENFTNDTGYAFGIFLPGHDSLIGRVNLTNVARGAWQNCTIGYFLDEQWNGRGLTTEAVRLAVQFAFDHAGLHRVQAAVMPRNLASIRVLEKVGFHYEGLAEYYLQINGQWEHHKIYSITREYYKQHRTIWSVS